MSTTQPLRNTISPQAHPAPSHAPAAESQTALGYLHRSAVAQFRSQGFLAVPALCDETELLEIRSMLMSLFRQQAGRDEGNHFDMLSLDDGSGRPIQPQIIKPSLYAPALLCTTYFRRVREIARQLMGPDAEFSFDHSILKPAGSASATPWHQDEAHGHDAHYHHGQISFWMPFQPVSLRNGCMRYIPESNHGPLLPHRALEGDLRIHAIECPSGYFNEARAHPQPVAAGDCILHDGLTLHSAMPNCSDQDRLAYVLAFRGPAQARPHPVAFTWLEPKQTESFKRSMNWRRRGGFAVLAYRLLRRAWASDWRTWGASLRRLVQAQIRRSHAPP